MRDASRATWQVELADNCILLNVVHFYLLGVVQRKNQCVAEVDSFEHFIVSLDFADLSCVIVALAF